MNEINKNKPINLNDYFAKARNEEPVFTKDEARNLIENSTHLATSNHSLLNKITLGGNKMTTLSLAFSSVAAVGLLTYSLLFNDAGNDENKINATKFEEQSTSKSHFGFNDYKISANNQTLDDYYKTDDEFQKIASYEEFNANPNSPKLKLIELTPEQLSNLGISVAPDGKSANVYSSKDRTYKVYVDWGISIIKDKSEFPSKIKPLLITDNRGNQRISLSIDDKDYGKIYSQSLMHIVRNNPENIEKIEADIYNSMNNPNWDSKFANFPEINLDSIIAFTKIVLDKNAEDIQVIKKKFSMSQEEFQDLFNDKNFQQQRYFKSTDSVLKEYNFIFDEEFNYETSIITENENEEETKKDIKKIQIKVLNSFGNDSTNNQMKDLILRFDDKDFDSINESILNTFPKLTNWKDSMKVPGYSEVYQDSVFTAIFERNYDKNKNVTTQKKIIIAEPQLMAENILKQVRANYHEINKLVPIAVPVPNAVDRNGTKLNNFKFVVWYEPSDELLELLPQNIAEQIRKELNLFENTDDLCDVDAIAGKETYFDVWRTCNGSLQNLSVFPNPTSGPVNIKFDLKERRNVSIELHNLLGQKLKELGNLSSLRIGEVERNIDISDLEPGLYLIVVTTAEGEQVVQRIIKN